MTHTLKTAPRQQTKTIVKKQREVVPSVIPYLSKSGQLLLPKGLLPILAKTPAEIRMVEKALIRKRVLGVIQPLKETKTQKQLYQVGCVGRITTFSENDDGSLYIILKGLKRFHAVQAKPSYLEVDYAPYNDDQIAFDGEQPKDRERLMGLLKDYFRRIDMDINWNDSTSANDESLTTSLAMMCPFDANEKQAILESTTVEERIEMITAFIEMNAMKKSPLSWTPH